MSLRKALQSAVNQRNASLWVDRSHVQDLAPLRAAIGRAEVFLYGYPVASEERVLEYIESHLDDIGRILFANNKGPLMQAYKKAMKKQLQPTRP